MFLKQNNTALLTVIQRTSGTSFIIEHGTGHTKHVFSFEPKTQKFVNKIGQ